MEITKFNLEYKAVYNFQTVTMSCEFTGDASDEDIANTKEYLRQFTEAAVKELANDLPTQQNKATTNTNNHPAPPQPARANNYGYSRNVANQYPAATNGYPKKGISDKQRNILLRAGYENSEIDSWDAATVKQVIGEILNNQ